MSFVFSLINKHIEECHSAGHLAYSFCLANRVSSLCTYLVMTDYSDDDSDTESKICIGKIYWAKPLTPSDASGVPRIVVSEKTVDRIDRHWSVRTASGSIKGRLSKPIPAHSWYYKDANSYPPLGIEAFYTSPIRK